MELETNVGERVRVTYSILSSAGLRTKEGTFWYPFLRGRVHFGTLAKLQNGKGDSR